MLPSINAAILAGVVLGDTIHVYGNNLIESFEIPAGVVLEIIMEHNKRWNDLQLRYHQSQWRNIHQ